MVKWSAGQLWVIPELIYRLLGFFEWACHIKNVDILGGTPTWDLDVPVHLTGANYAGGQV